MIVCPVCGEDRNADLSKIREQLSRYYALVGEHVDPGGRVLVFANGSHLRLDDQCNACDEEKIRDFLRGSTVGQPPDGNEQG